ncbi:NUDIX domain-containing protein [Solibacillus sp. CAU 1738]|uniref:NUDIX hydrolase n=1 Tax=Solibacillus sp. CAU 1738 TaxID=3140363 RepID=UPI00325FEA0F
MRIRSTVVIVENDKVLLIKRVKDSKTYYVFPGGGVEQGETIEQAAIREAFEEVGVHVELTGLLCEVPFNGLQYYFEANIIGGVVGTGVGEEYTNSVAYSGTYEPVWVASKQLSLLDVRPIEVVKIITSK